MLTTMPGVTKYNFDLEAARQTLAQNPLHIDRALNEGFRAHTQEIELPGFGDAKRSMFEFFKMSYSLQTTYKVLGLQ